MEGKRMMLILGLGMVFGLVFGGFMLSGGKMDIVLYALPFEGMMIGGGAIGAFIIANSMSVVKDSAHGVVKVMKGPKWKQQDYSDLLKLLFELARLYKTKGVIALDEHVERPAESEIFKRYPKVLADHFAIDLITDSFRMLAMQFDDQFQTEEVLNRKLKKHHHESLAAAKAIQTMADGLPAIGIVAAVLGVIKTMSSVDEPPEVLGKMIGGALVGTFLGVFLAYCMVAPISGRLRQIEEEDAAFYAIIRDVFVAMVADHPPNICIEIGRGNIPSHMQPDFYEVEASQQDLAAA
jgi:chemotaxis protein MotA